MPKNKKKGKRCNAEAATAQTEHGFDDMIAELQAEDLANASTPISSRSSITITSATTSTTRVPTPSALSRASSASSSSGSSAPRVQGGNATKNSMRHTAVKEDILEAIRARDFARLREWARQSRDFLSPYAQPLLRETPI
jgi:hypothetical protein